MPLQAIIWATKRHANTWFLSNKPPLDRLIHAFARTGKFFLNKQQIRTINKARKRYNWKQRIMKNQQSQIEIEDETTVVRVLSAVFITLMILIIGSYSDIPQEKIAQNQQTQTIAHTANTNNLNSLNADNRDNRSTGQVTVIKTNFNTQLRPGLTFN